MSDVSISSTVHLHGCVSVQSHLHRDNKTGWVDIGRSYPNVSIHCDADQADRIAAAFARLADMIRDASRSESDPIVGEDDCCDLGSTPVPYVPLS